MPGTVTIDDKGEAHGEGHALGLYHAILAEESAAKPLADPATPDPDWEGTPEDWAELITALNVKMKRAWACTARAHAKWYVNVLTRSAH